jgi:hypothetical protein
VAMAKWCPRLIKKGNIKICGEKQKKKKKDLPRLSYS